MTFIIQKSKLNPHANHSKEFEFENSGMTIKFRPATHPHFQKVHALIQKYNKDGQSEQDEQPVQDGQFEQDEQPEQEPLPKLDKNTITQVNDDELSPTEAIIYAVGEYLIVDWNITIDDDGVQEKLTPSGDNLLALISSISEPDVFIAWCFECVGAISTEVQQNIIELKKKPSKGGSGSKTTKT